MVGVSKRDLSYNLFTYDLLLTQDLNGGNVSSSGTDFITQESLGVNGTQMRVFLLMVDIIKENRRFCLVVFEPPKFVVFE